MRILTLVILFTLVAISNKKIASIGIDATDILMNLEQSANIIYTDSVSLNNYKILQPEAVLSSDILNIEDLKARGINLIFIGWNQKLKNIEEIKASGIKTVHLKMHNNRREFENDLRICGEVLKKFNYSVDLETDLNTKYAEIELINFMNEIKDVVKFDGNKFWLAPKISIQSVLIKISGAKNFSKNQKNWQEISLEDLVSCNHILMHKENFKLLQNQANKNDLAKLSDKIILTDHSFESFEINTPDEILRILNDLISIQY